MGCFFAGCCHGIPTDLPWAITFPEHAMCAAPPNIALHPTQIYETIASIAIFGILWSLRHKMLFSGGLFAIYLVFVGIERLVVEFLRQKDDYFIENSNFTVAQIIGIGLCILGISLYFYRAKKAKTRLSSE